MSFNIDFKLETTERSFILKLPDGVGQTGIHLDNPHYMHNL